ncbi:MAG: hypothetical protein EOO54_10145 [Haliea sp.]|nr:MAG: hypothetical protein EOO54_10145 [Haliea sp.]
MEPTPTASGPYAEARLAILIALLQANATSVGAMMAAEGEGIQVERLVRLADQMAAQVTGPGGDAGASAGVGASGTYVAKGAPWAGR